MNLEDRIRLHYENRVPSNSEPVDIDGVLARGTRLRHRTYVGAAFLSVAGVAVFALTTAMLWGRSTPEADSAASLPPQSLHDQILESWTPVPDPVDPELAAIASDLCPFDGLAFAGAPEPVVLVGEPSILAIDQRGITATILHGGATTDGEVAQSCSVIKLDGTWHPMTDIDEDLPSMSGGHGGPFSEYVTEIRLRFPDGTEVTATVGERHYVISYPSALYETLTEPDSYVYMDHYMADGSLISSEPYMSYSDRQEMQSLTSRIGQPLPEFDLVAIPGFPQLSPHGETEVTVMIVWTPSCQHCGDQLAVLRDTLVELGHRVPVVGIATSGTPGEAVEVLRSRGITSIPNMFDVGNADLNKLSIGAVPMTLIADADGVVVAEFAGVTGVDELLDAITLALE